MNLVLLLKNEVNVPITRTDRRFRHLKRVLKIQPGDTLRCGILDGPIGIMHIETVDDKSISYQFYPQSDPPPLYPIHLVCGLSRPQQVKRILRDCTSLGVSSIHFIPTENSEKSFVHSPIWTGDSIQNLMIEGLEQSGSTIAPIIEHLSSVNEFISNNSEPENIVILDNLPNCPSLSNRLSTIISHDITLVIGSERGWTANERLLFQNAGFVSAHMGTRILRTDTACIAAVSLALSGKY